MNRRDFLKLAGCFIASSSAATVNTGCHSQQSVNAYFPQGVTSGDPGPGSIMLWTRAVPLDNSTSTVTITLEVAADESFSSLVHQQNYNATDASDHTVRILLEGLQPDSTYYYRFINGDTASVTGRTRTAPDPLSMQPVKLAFMSCQERRHGFYNTYRRLLLDDLSAAENEQIQFILHLGDFIYETRNDPLQAPIGNDQQTLDEDLTDNNSLKRSLDAFIDGATSSEGIEFALTLNDYRQLYQQYLSDPDLQAARARWPFIPVWDDHEFTDDCWQTEANYENAGENSSTDEPSQVRKVAANQAWFEYMPVNLMQPETTDDDLHHSHDFNFVEVENTPNTLINSLNQITNEDNLNAIGSLTIYRNLQFGAMLQLVLTDNRSYRSDHAIPEDITGNIDLFISPRVALPLDLLNDLDAGRTANNGNPDNFLFIGSLVLNPRRYSPPGTILGDAQKNWFKQTLQRSSTRWKIWGNTVPLMRMLFNLSAVDSSLSDIVLSGDTWDGYHTERNELMKFLLDNDIRNVVSLSGDLHAHFAGEVWNDYDTTSARQVAMVEAVCSSVSSISQFSAVERLSRRTNPTAAEALVRELITYDSRLSSSPGTDPYVTNLNNTLLNGTVSGQVAAITHDLSQINSSKDPGVNPHLKYADTQAHGYGIATIAQHQMTIEIVTINSINEQTDQAIQKKRTAKFIIPYTEPGQQASISEAEFTGIPAFPFALE